MARCVAFYADVYAPGLRTARAARVYRPPVGAVHEDVPEAQGSLVHTPYTYQSMPYI
jgi:hypothetical protein